MSSVSVTFTNSLILFSPRTTRKPRIFQSRQFNYTQVTRNWFRVRVVQRDDNGVVVEEREMEFVTQLNGSVNGRSQSNGSYSFDKGEKDGENGTLMKYLNGNGNGNGGVVEVVEVEKVKEKKKRNVEDIGQEEAWFKQKVDSSQVKVSVAPGGRWSRFKTYSTIQRTMEFWGFVLTFVFRVWFSNQKFSYRGGMTEDKKKEWHKVLAKWLKENILRLGPTFIKIGQQFSTKVDILAH